MRRVAIRVMELYPTRLRRFSWPSGYNAAYEISETNAARDTYRSNSIYSPVTPAMLCCHAISRKRSNRSCFVSGLARADYLLAISILLLLFAGAWATWSAFSCMVAGKTIPWLPVLPRIAVRKYWLP